jgi:hypothetical protein
MRYMIASSLRCFKEVSSRNPVIGYQENLASLTTLAIGTRVSQRRENFRTYARADTDQRYRRRDRRRAERAIR